MTRAMTVESLYEQHIKSLPVHDRLRLMAMVANDLSRVSPSETTYKVSPRLAQPEQVADFAMTVDEAESDAGV